METKYKQVHLMSVEVQKHRNNIVLEKDTCNLVLEKHLAIPFSDTDWPAFAEPARQKTETTFNPFDTDTLFPRLVFTQGPVTWSGLL